MPIPELVLMLASVSVPATVVTAAAQVPVLVLVLVLVLLLKQVVVACRWRAQDAWGAKATRCHAGMEEGARELARAIASVGARRAALQP